MSRIADMLFTLVCGIIGGLLGCLIMWVVEFLWSKI